MDARLIPVLLVRDGGLVKTVRFRDGTYLGDPLNAIRIFNDLRVDEILVLDISASREGRGPDLGFLREVAREAFMPFGYGGGVRTLEDVRSVLQIGIEKVALNHATLQDPGLLGRAAREFGSQSVVAALDVERGRDGALRVYDHVAGRATAQDAAGRARLLEESGAGEIFVNWADRDGAMEGYDLEGIRTLSRAAGVPLVACGGAGELADLGRAVQAGAAGAAAGSLFVYRGKRRGILISYPPAEDVARVLQGPPA